MRSDLPHEASLVPVTIATASQDHDAPTTGCRRDRIQHPCHRIRAVRIVDDDREGLARSDRLHTARHAHIRHAGAEHISIDTHEPQSRPRAKSVSRIESAGQSHVHAVHRTVTVHLQALPTRQVGDGHTLHVSIMV